MAVSSHHPQEVLIKPDSFHFILYPNNWSQNPAANEMFWIFEMTRYLNSNLLQLLIEGSQASYVSNHIDKGVG